MNSPRFKERAKLCALFGLQSQAQGMWYVPFPTVLKAHGLEALIPWALAITAAAAWLSPMISGTLADRHFAPVRVLRWLATGVGVFTTAVFFGIEHHWATPAIVCLYIIQQLFYVPTWGLSSSIVFAQLEHPERDFGPVRVWATLGWMLAGPIVSYVIRADASTISGFAAAAEWLAVGAFTWALPETPPRSANGHRRWRDLLGFDAFCIFKEPNHRAILLGSALLSVPLAALYQVTVLHLQDLGETRGAAAMSLGQVTEMISMYALAPLLARAPVKGVFLAGAACGVIRYALFALNSKSALFTGIFLHGFCFAFFFVVAQIYFDKWTAPQFRVRAQALLTLLTSGVGSFVGALACGWWRKTCTTSAGTQWSLHWAVLSGVMAIGFIYFAAAFRGGKRRLYEAGAVAGELPAAAQPLIANTPE